MRHLQPEVALLQLPLMTTIKWHLGHVVRILREERRWNQQDLADKAGVNKATVVSVEQMDRNHGRDTYESIARAFEMTLAELYALVPTERETQRDETPSTAGGRFSR